MNEPGAQVSPQWAAWRGVVDLAEYESRFVADDAHGEADLLGSLGRRSVLDAGCGTGRVAIELARRGFDAAGVDLDDDMIALARAKAPDVAWTVADLARMQLTRRFEVVAMPGNVMLYCRAEDRRSVVHSCVQHLEPSGLLVAGFQVRHAPGELTLDEYDRYAADCELTLVERWATWDRQPYEGGNYAVSVHRRTERFNVHDLLFEARAAIRRVTPTELDALIASTRPPLVIDTRSHVDRARTGVIEGSVHIPRSALEWHVDPANGFRHPEVTSFDQPLVVVCDDGYSSSLAAASLGRLGFTDVADLAGGVRAWRSAGLPLITPNHSHLTF